MPRSRAGRRRSPRRAGTRATSRMSISRDRCVDDRGGAGRRSQPRGRRRAEHRRSARPSPRSPAPARSSASRRASIPQPATASRPSSRDRPVAVLSGPNIAEEISRGLPAAAVIAGEDHALSVQLQLAITSPAFRVYVNDDVAGVELCAAAKNVIALAAGGADGLGLGDNAKAALVARGLAEMGRFAEAAGARPETFAGLAGMGDLIVTCWSKVRPQPPLRRARRAGRDARPRPWPRSGWSSKASRPRPCCASSRTVSMSRCRSPKVCAPCSTASRSATRRDPDGARPDVRVAPGAIG